MFIVTSPPVGGQSIANSVSVYLSTCISQQELIRRWDSERTC